MRWEKRRQFGALVQGAEWTSEGVGTKKWAGFCNGGSGGAGKCLFVAVVGQ